MPLVPFDGFLGGSHQRQQPGINTERCINLYPELPDRGEHGRSQGSLLSTPGLRKYWTIPGNQPVVALYTLMNFTISPVLPVSYAIGSPDGANAHLYELPFVLGQAPTDRGTLGPAGRYKMVGGGYPGQILIIDQIPGLTSGTGWVYTLSSRVLTPLAGVASWPGSTDIAFMDGFFFRFDHWDRCRP
jgi:hypothetical protein